VQLGEGVRLGDRYVLGPVLGAGGTAHVYRAFDERLGVSVAVKVLSLANPVARDRLKQEATVQAGLRHPHIVSVTDVLDVDGWPAVVMELVDGPTLGDLLDAGPLPPEEAVELFRGILEGVAAAHTAGTVHRDLKPGNVLVARVGRRLHPKVADFGLAKVLAGPGGGTRTGAIMGTPRYMSPEQLSDSKAVDERSDVFALGAILFELLTGRPAFDGRSTLDLFNRIAMGQHAPIPDDLDAGLAQLIEQALEIEPSDRLPSAQAFLDRLPREPSGSSWGTVSADRPPAAQRPRSDATWSEAVEPPEGEPTMQRPPPPASSLEPTRVEDPSPRRRHGWVGVVVVASLVGLAALGWLSLPSTPAAAGFTVDDVPALSSDDADRRLALAWHALEHNAGDLDVLLTQAAAADPGEPAVALVRALSAYPVDAEGLRAILGEGVARARGAHGPVPELLVAVHDAERSAESPGWLDPVLREHLERWPDDRLARLWRVKAMAADPASVPLDEAFVQSVLDEAPDHAFAWILAVTTYRGHGRFDDADGIGRAALDAGQGSAWLLSELAVNALQRGRHAEAIDYGVQSLRLEPGSWPPRLHAAMGAAHLGDMETFERLVAPMRGDEFPVAGRRRFAFFVARGLATLGQLERSAEWAAVARRAAEGSDAQQTLVRIAAMEVEMRLHPWTSDSQDLAASLAALDRAVADPTLPAASRHDPGLLSVLAHGLLAARDGAEATAQRALGRLEGDHADRLAVAIARAAGRPAPDVEGCHGLVDAAVWSLERAEVDRAAAQARRALDVCPHTDSQPFALAQGVRAALGEGGARDDFDATWPAPDPDLPVMRVLGAP